jgi:hypothetical protein
MKNKLKVIMLFWLFVAVNTLSQTQPDKTDAQQQGNRLGYQVVGNDTIYLAFLRDVHIYPPLKFTSKNQEKFYWRTVRDVKKTLPYAKIVGREFRAVNALLPTLPKEIDRKKYLSQYEKDIFRKYEPDLRKFTVSQGRLLLKLIDRECNSTSYDLIKSYRGNVSAVFWQGIARIFGSNLKSQYDASGDDKIVERVIVLVESGQL